MISAICLAVQGCPSCWAIVTIARKAYSTVCEIMRLGQIQRKSGNMDKRTLTSFIANHNLLSNTGLRDQLVRRDSQMTGLLVQLARDVGRRPHRTLTRAVEDLQTPKWDRPMPKAKIKRPRLKSAMDVRQQVVIDAQ